MSSAKIVIGNWKMHGSWARLCEFADLLGHEKLACQAALCVPFPLLGAAQAALQATPLRWGAQDCSTEAEGAYTGEVSAHMIREAGARYVLVGHSDRRRRHRETDGLVAVKARRALAAGLTPIVCVGETADERDLHQTESVLRSQLRELVRALDRDIAHALVAYVPVWAVGRGDAATPGLIDDALDFIEQTLALHGRASAGAVRLLYGGSVQPGNAEALLSRRRVDGVLVGAASLRAHEFADICRAAARCMH
jgi:triosephosphate isomerase